MVLCLRKTGLLGLILTISACSTHGGQPQVRAPTPIDYLPAVSGTYFPLDAKSLGRTFHIFVRLPEGYADNPDAEYPVVYVLDGDSLFPVVAPNHLFLSYDEDLPEAIIVGIAYGSFDPAINKRGYDFSPPTADGDPARGGAPDFLSFLAGELIPRIEQDFRADAGKRVLFGQSRGGQMVLYAAFKQPDLFRGYIASNPSFDPGREVLFAPPASAERRDLGLVVTSGTRDYPALREAALAWSEAWKDHADLPWALNFVSIEGGTHAAFSASSYRLGMLWLFGRE